MSSIVGVKAVGNYVLVEHLTPQECMNTNLIITKSSKDSYQAVVLDIGPLVNKDYGLQVGQRVIISGTCIPVPNYDSSHRERSLLLPDTIKGLIIEE